MSNIKTHDLNSKLEDANKVIFAYDGFIGFMEDACRQLAGFNVTGIFDDTAIDKLAHSIELFIISSGHDDRVIGICRSLMLMAKVPDRECFIDAAGKFHRRQIYFAQRLDGAIKIGSSIDVVSRVRSLRTGAGEELTLLYQIQGSTSREKQFHKIFKEENIHGEWFKPDKILILITQSKDSQQKAKLKASCEIAMIQPSLLN